MFYLIQNHYLEEIELQGGYPDEKASLIGYLTRQELEEQYQLLQIPPTIVERCVTENSHFNSSLEVYDEYSFGVINIVNVMNAKEARDRIAIIIRHNLLILVKIIDEDDNTRVLFQESVTLQAECLKRKNIIWCFGKADFGSQ